MAWLESLVALTDYLGLYRPSRRPGSGALIQAGSYSHDEALDLASYVRTSFGDPAKLAVADLGAGPGESELGRHVAEIPWRRLVSIEHSISHLDRLGEATYRAARHEILTGHIDQVFTEYRPGELDVALMLNVVHQFPRGKALGLLKQCETFFNKGAIVFTPLGAREDVLAASPEPPVPNSEKASAEGKSPTDSESSAKPIRAKSVWRAAQFKRLGYDVTVYRSFFDRASPPVDAAWAIKRWGIS